MTTFRSLISIAAIVTAGLAAANLSPAHAREHGRIVHGHGPGGGFIAGRHVSREPGSATVTRGRANANGRGYLQQRTTQRGNGTVSNHVERQYRNGKTVERNGSVTRNPDGSVSRERSRTGGSGNSQNSWSTIYRTDDGYQRSRGASTSQGRGYNATRDVSVSDDSVQINRNAATNSGRSVSSSRTYPRPQ